MAQAKKCDRCGGFYEHYDGSARFGETEGANAAFLIDRGLKGEGYWERKIYDLCPDCMEFLEKWLNAERKQEDRIDWDAAADRVRLQRKTEPAEQISESKETVVRAT